MPPQETHAPDPDGELAQLSKDVRALVKAFDERGFPKKGGFLPTRVLELIFALITIFVVFLAAWARSVDNVVGQVFTKSDAAKMELNIQKDRAIDIDRLRSSIQQELRDHGRMDP